MARTMRHGELTRARTGRNADGRREREKTPPRINSICESRTDRFGRTKRVALDTVLGFSKDLRKGNAEVACHWLGEDLGCATALEIGITGSSGRWRGPGRQRCPVTATVQQRRSRTRRLAWAKRPGLHWNTTAAGGRVGCVTLSAAVRGTGVMRLVVLAEARF